MPARLLFIKSLLVGTSIEPLLLQLRWFLGLKQRLMHPELWELYLENERTHLLLRKLLQPESCCIDVGCHIGSFLSILKQYAPRGMHIVFEPSPIKNAWLKRRFTDVEVFPYAVSDTTGNAVFEEDLARPAAFVGRLRQPDDHQTSGKVSYDVRTCRLDDVILQKNRVDLIKLDIEGGELAALRGAIETIRKHNPLIIFECGSEHEVALPRRRELYDFVTNDLCYDIFCFVDFLFDKGPMAFDEFRKCGLYPFRAFNFVARPRG